MGRNDKESQESESMGLFHAQLDTKVKHYITVLFDNFLKTAKTLK
jgi:hypothetical protein